MVQLTNLDVAFKLTFLNFCEYIILFRLFFDNKYRLFVYCYVGLMKCLLS